MSQEGVVLFKSAATPLPTRCLITIDESFQIKHNMNLINHLIRGHKASSGQGYGSAFTYTTSLKIYPFHVIQKIIRSFACS